MSDWDALKVHSMTPEKYDESDPFVPDRHGSIIDGTPTGGTGCGWVAETTGPDTGRVGTELGCNEAPWYGSDGPGITVPLKRIGQYITLHISTLLLTSRNGVCYPLRLCSG